MARKKTSTYPITRPDGRVVRVSVPDTQEPTLGEVLREHLSPEAVAAIAAWLQPAHTNDAKVDREVRWFIDQLRGLLGEEQASQLAQQLGL